MNNFLKLFLVGALVSFTSPLFSREMNDSELRKDHSSEKRMLCTTITQGQYVRFNRCRNGEVMTGIQGFDPLTVYCTTLMANCRTPHLKYEQE